MVASRPMNVEIAYEVKGKLLATLKVKPRWSSQIVEVQDRDLKATKIDKRVTLTPRRRETSYRAGDKVSLKVSPWKRGSRI